MRFPSEALKTVLKSEAARDFLLALFLLGIALYLGLLADAAAHRGESAPGIVLSLLSLVIAMVVALTLVPRLARRVPFSSWLLPMSFSITREGGVYILVIFLLSLAAINTGNNLLFLILALLLSAIVASGTFARASLRSLFVSMSLPENVYVNEHVSIKVSLRNAKRLLPSFSVTVEDSGAHQPGRPHRRWRASIERALNPSARRAADRAILRHTAYFPYLPPRETRSVLVSQSFPARGRYTLEGFRLNTRFPFGFFKRGERVHAGGEVLVYPKVEEVSSYFHLLPFLPGHMESRRIGLGESLYALRKYRDGENARRVDWKATAKTGELMAREYAREEESELCLILDNRIDGGQGAESCSQFEKAVSLAASLAVHFTDEGAELEYLTPDEHLSSDMGPDQLHRILRSLAVIEAKPSPPSGSQDLRKELAAVVDAPVLQEIMSPKVFKIIITSKPRGCFSSSMWRSSHVVYFDEL